MRDGKSVLFPGEMEINNSCSFPFIEKVEFNLIRSDEFTKYDAFIVVSYINGLSVIGDDTGEIFLNICPVREGTNFITGKNLFVLFCYVPPLRTEIKESVDFIVPN